MREYQFGIKYEKSVLENFAEKYVIEGKPRIIPIDYFGEKTPRIKQFFKITEILKLECYWFV